MNVDLPAPGAPLIAIRIVFGLTVLLYLNACLTKSRFNCDDLFDSTNVIARDNDDLHPLTNEQNNLLDFN